jgi:hypothetical protein
MQSGKHIGKIVLTAGEADTVMVCIDDILAPAEVNGSSIYTDKAIILP